MTNHTTNTPASSSSSPSIVDNDTDEVVDEQQEQQQQQQKKKELCPSPVISNSTSNNNNEQQQEPSSSGDGNNTNSNSNVNSNNDNNHGTPKSHNKHKKPKKVPSSSSSPTLPITMMSSGSTTTASDAAAVVTHHGIVIPASAASNIPHNTYSKQRIRLGICAMDKKAKSKPMAEILSRLDAKLFHVIFFGNDVILHEEIQNWPIVDVLIAFFSNGYPLEKAINYVKLRNPCVINDLKTQDLLQDRRRVYDLLQASGIDVPRHVFLSRDGYISTGMGQGSSNNNNNSINKEDDDDDKKKRAPQNKKKASTDDDDDDDSKHNTKQLGGKIMKSSQEPVLEEYDDHIVVNGITIHKPFVEKPVNSEDHNICIYYPSSAGGGCKKLFRKVGNRSSSFYPNINQVRKDNGSYIYEEFVETQGTDVKMYTVGPEYGHAEARKSPTVDGKVERNADGKEVRFPVILSFREKEIARRIVLVFKQFVCGFDILRVQEGHSLVPYVCDVNGWSFVKNSRKYYDDCSQVLSEHILAMAKPSLFDGFSTVDPLVTTSLNRESGANLAEMARLIATKTIRTSNCSNNRRLQPPPRSHSRSVDGTSSSGEEKEGDDRTGELLQSAAATLLMEGALPVRDFPERLTSEPASMNQSANSSVGGETPKSPHHPKVPTQQQALPSPLMHEEELRCVLAIVRHGDRTPKQKLKVVMQEPHILDYFHKHVKNCRKDLKVKAITPMTEFLETVKITLTEMPREPGNESLRHQLLHMRDILERWKIAGLNRKIQIKPRKFEEYQDESSSESKSRCTEVQLILKWGGNLTKLGEKQAVHLGRKLRHDLYPDNPGGGILRLHSTFRHDMKIKTSDEGRVMKTAAAFAKGLLELEGDLPPILVSLVHKEKGSMHMLDPSGNKEVKMALAEIKKKITANLQRDVSVGEASEDELELLVGPKVLTALRDAIRKVGNPRQILVKIHKSMGELISQLDEMIGEMGSGDEKHIERGEEHVDFALSGVKLYKGETLLELTERWRFIYDRLYDEEKDEFDLSRIPDVHDNVRFDVLHNPHLGLSETLHRLYELTKTMADCVVPQEYGTTLEERKSIGLKICHGLLEKIKYDLNIARADDQVDMRYMLNMDYSADLPINTFGRRIRSRLYFTSESHLHTVLNALRFANPGDSSLLSEEGRKILNASPELCYLTQVVMRVFEDSRSEMANDPRRFRVEILFSPGANSTPMHMHELLRDKDPTRLDTAPLQNIGREGLTCQEVEEFLEVAIQEGQMNDEGDSNNDEDDDD